jgi:tellurium resistance protein TerD
MLKLQKGGKLKMQSTDGSAINSLRLELGWSPQVFSSGSQFDLDVSAVALIDNSNPDYPFGHSHSEDFVLFYNSRFRTSDGKTTFIDDGDVKQGRPAVPGCAMIHSGDSRDGVSEGADEIIHMSLDRMPEDVNVVHVLVTIDKGVERGQHFGMVNDSWVRVFNDTTNERLAEYKLEDDIDHSTALLFVELRKRNGEWGVKAANQGFKNGLREFFRLYGLPTE